MVFSYIITGENKALCCYVAISSSHFDSDKCLNSRFMRLLGAKIGISALLEQRK
jgi:hypothetical protein